MKPNRILWLIVAAMFLMAVRGDADEPAPRAALSDIASMDGKIVALTLMSDSEDFVLLGQATEKTIGGRKFLLGEGVDDGETPDWRNGAAVWVPIDDVQQIVVFANLDQYRKNMDARGTRGEGKAAVYRTSTPGARRTPTAH